MWQWSLPRSMSSIGEDRNIFSFGGEFLTLFGVLVACRICCCCCSIRHWTLLLPSALRAKIKWSYSRWQDARKKAGILYLKLQNYLSHAFLNSIIRFLGILFYWHIIRFILFLNMVPITWKLFVSWFVIIPSYPGTLHSNLLKASSVDSAAKKK